VSHFLALAAVIGSADSHAYSVKPSLISDIIGWLVGFPIMVVIVAGLSILVCSPIFYLILFRSLSYLNTLKYAAYYMAFLFTWLVLFISVLCSLGAIFVVLFLIKLFFEIKDKTVWQIYNFIPDLFRSKALFIEQQLTAH
jgi:hypothetical protein